MDEIWLMDEKIGISYSNDIDINGLNHDIDLTT